MYHDHHLLDQMRVCETKINFPTTFFKYGE